jgi:chlorite dismutase
MSRQLEEEKPQKIGNQQEQKQIAKNVVREARQFLKYTFFKIQPHWRRLPNLEIAEGKDDLRKVLRDSENRKMTMKFYSLVGIRGYCDFMVWSFSDTL